jgi:hypothetical protein
MASIDDVRQNIQSYSPEAVRYHHMMMCMYGGNRRVKEEEGDKSSRLLFFFFPPFVAVPDIILPLGIGYFFFMAITFLAIPYEQTKEGKVSNWSYVAFVAMLTDYAENICIFLILSYQGKLLHSLSLLPLFPPTSFVIYYFK